MLYLKAWWHILILQEWGDKNIPRTITLLQNDIAMFLWAPSELHADLVLLLYSCMENCWNCLISLTSSSKKESVFSSSPFFHHFPVVSLVNKHFAKMLDICFLYCHLALHIYLGVGAICNVMDSWFTFCESPLTRILILCSPSEFQITWGTWTWWKGYWRWDCKLWDGWWRWYLYAFLDWHHYWSSQC